MTRLTLKDATLRGYHYDEGMFEITLTCRISDVNGEVVSINSLNVEINGKDKGEMARGI